MSIFILMVAVGLFFTSILAAPSAPFSEQARDTSTTASSSFERLSDWTVKVVPITIDAPTAVSNYPVELKYAMPSSYDPASVAVTTLSDNTQNIQFDRHDNKTTILTSLSSNKTNLELSYTQDTDLANLSQQDYLNRTGDTWEAAGWNATLDSNGINSLYYENEIYITNTTFDELGTDQEWKSGTIRHVRTYENGTIRGFGGADQIRTDQDNADSTVYTHINLSSSFDTLDTSDGQTSLSGNGTFYDGTTDFATFTYTDGTTYGFTVVGDSMNLIVGRPVTGGELQTNLTTPDTSRSLMIIPHTGGESSISSERDVFLDSSVTVGLTQERTGVAEHELDAINNMTNDKIARELRMSEMEFNISIDGYSYGDGIPSGQDVAALEYPLPKLYRWGNTTTITLNLAVWL